MKISNLFLGLALACSLTTPALAQFNDPILDGDLADRQRQQGQLEAGSTYQQRAYNYQHEEEQQALIKNIALVVTLLSSTFLVFLLIYLKLKDQSKLEQHMRDNNSQK